MSGDGEGEGRVRVTVRWGQGMPRVMVTFCGVMVTQL